MTSFTFGLKAALLTPAGVFVVCCLLAPPLLETIDSTIIPTALDVLALYTALPVLGWFSVAIAVIWYTFVGCGTPVVVNLSSWEVWIASWYLINGFF